jgi:hypothetical protein
VTSNSRIVRRDDETQGMEWSYARPYALSALSVNGLRAGVGVALVAVSLGGAVVLTKLPAANPQGPPYTQAHWGGYAGGTVIAEQVARDARADQDRRPIYVEPRFSARLK